jgi:DNA-directed RNA polymerase specialized sigma subunit
MCSRCRRRLSCRGICPQLEEVLPSPDQGRVDKEDLPRLAQGRLVTNLILDHEEELTERQREIVRLYYREAKLQREVAAVLHITQQAVADCLARLRQQIFTRIRKRWHELYRAKLT